MFLSSSSLSFSLSSSSSLLWKIDSLRDEAGYCGPISAASAWRIAVLRGLSLYLSKLWAGYGCAAIPFTAGAQLAALAHPSLGHLLLRPSYRCGGVTERGTRRGSSGIGSNSVCRRRCVRHACGGGRELDWCSCRSLRLSVAALLPPRGRGGSATAGSARRGVPPSEGARDCAPAAH